MVIYVSIEQNRGIHASFARNGSNLLFLYLFKSFPFQVVIYTDNDAE